MVILFKVPPEIGILWYRRLNFAGITKYSGIHVLGEPEAPGTSVKLGSWGLPSCPHI